MVTQELSNDSKAIDDKSEFLLITSSTCHLCSRARSVLTALSLEVQEIDVDSTEAVELATQEIPLTLLPVLLEKIGEEIRVVAYGRFSERRLRKDFKQ
jgi:Glutaredoxin-like domain (DUF836).